MCLAQPATVVELRQDELVVAIDGRRSVVTNLLVPEARVGDEVLVGMGIALASLEQAEAAELRAALEAALVDEPVADPPQPSTPGRRPPDPIRP
jgi:hydrogenase expression/formation protein HypC